MKQADITERRPEIVHALQAELYRTALIAVRRRRQSRRAHARRSEAIRHLSDHHRTTLESLPDE